MANGTVGKTTLAKAQLLKRKQPAGESPEPKGPLLREVHLDSQLLLLG